MNPEPEIYFHVGLGKVASTWLQKKVFPKLKGLQYFGPHRYRKVKSLLPKAGSGKVLVSREFDRQLEEELRDFGQHYPRFRVVVIFRRHDEWIASQYRRYVKNGWLGTFSDFYDLESDQGFWKRKELDYRMKIETIERISGQKPVVLIYDDLKNDPRAFVAALADSLGVKPPARLFTGKVHASYSEKQLKVLQAFCRRFIGRVPQGKSNKLLHWLTYKPYWAVNHLVLYGASFWPVSWMSSDPLIPEGQLEAVRTHFAEDWKYIQTISQPID
ncbi:hypothetical protein [Marinoscillum furvescens]|uniref:Sulfotransferase family protein n=1 Tax=Marinoscillum furvescens DSM 4134 TaxID=1122208 RepID=A0A3D9LIE6_MARFU|nr:hypothetical protein [Marinoscillum furvescens]REE05593.1 hypothetical protein C7460_101110 [Marinoscillum furvescens DSM 4134]